MCPAGPGLAVGRTSGDSQVLRICPDLGNRQAGRKYICWHCKGEERVSFSFANLRASLAHRRHLQKRRTSVIFPHPWCHVIPKDGGMAQLTAPRDRLTRNRSCVIMRANSHRSKLIRQSVKTTFCGNTSFSV